MPFIVQYRTSAVAEGRSESTVRAGASAGMVIWNVNCCTPGGGGDCCRAVLVTPGPHAQIHAVAAKLALALATW
jgi:hypothetical protein